MTQPYNNQQQKITCKVLYFVLPADHRLNSKESDKIDKYLDL